jgi:predicted DNA-binding transcriptional regulator AlpA
MEWRFFILLGVGMFLRKIKTNMDTLIVLKRSELDEAIRDAMISVLAENDPQKGKTNLTLPEAVEYLNDIGIPITKSTLYRHTMNATIPFKRFGKRKIIFSKTELDNWAQEKLK